MQTYRTSHPLRRYGFTWQRGEQSGFLQIDAETEDEASRQAANVVLPGSEVERTGEPVDIDPYAIEA